MENARSLQNGYLKEENALGEVRKTENKTTS